ncbi:hypothetical protein C7974DRAFT_444747 [Boeremia exigua]|uniref:uncharacterized protein n=1 Tax=Boeremia exigua TaxID=749465 RepID=UPI001E8E6CFE|nr:uncharacterized protein C7974DRAFT_444747 [Boeremia exigua]KAH6613133.1 hypothetical protein C7974DRAFT_444747 [Boeremia exigua]
MSTSSNTSRSSNVSTSSIPPNYSHILFHPLNESGKTPDRHSWGDAEEQINDDVSMGTGSPESPISRREWVHAIEHLGSGSVCVAKIECTLEGDIERNAARHSASQLKFDLDFEYDEFELVVRLSEQRKRRADQYAGIMDQMDEIEKKLKATKALREEATGNPLCFRHAYCQSEGDSVEKWNDRLKDFNETIQVCLDERQVLQNKLDCYKALDTEVAQLALDLIKLNSE